MKHALLGIRGVIEQTDTLDVISDNQEIINRLDKIISIMSEGILPRVPSPGTTLEDTLLSRIIRSLYDLANVCTVVRSGVKNDYTFNELAAGIRMEVFIYEKKY